VLRLPEIKNIQPPQLKKITEDYELKMHSFSGDLITESSHNMGKSIISVTDLTAGIYVIQLQTDSGIILTQKVAKF